MSRSKNLRATALTAVAALAVAAGASGAQGTPDRVKLDGERTTVTPSSALTQALAAANVTLAPAGRATAGEGGRLVFPIVRGRVARDTLRGRIVHRGAVRLTRGERSLRLRRLVIRTTRRGSVLTAKLGRANCRRALRRGTQRRALRRQAMRSRRGGLRRCGRGRLALARLTNVQRSDGGGLLVATADLALTRQAARRINRRLGARVVTGGASLGGVKVEAKPKF